MPNTSHIIVHNLHCTIRYGKWLVGSWLSVKALSAFRTSFTKCFSVEHD